MRPMQKSRVTREHSLECRQLFLAAGKLAGWLAAAGLPSLHGAVGFFLTSLPPGALTHAKRFSRTDELSSACARVVAVGPGLLSEKLSGLRKGQLCIFARLYSL